MTLLRDILMLDGFVGGGKLFRKHPQKYFFTQLPRPLDVRGSTINRKWEQCVHHWQHQVLVNQILTIRHTLLSGIVRRELPLSPSDDGYRVAL